MTSGRKRTIQIIIFFILFVYFSTYITIRQLHAEIWERDGNSYVIFPDDKIYLYYLYRPLSYFDGMLTGQRFHIGPHR